MAQRKFPWIARLMGQRKFKWVAIVALALILLAFHLKMILRKERRVAIAALALILLTSSITTYSTVNEITKRISPWSVGTASGIAVSSNAASSSLSFYSDNLSTAPRIRPQTLILKALPALPIKRLQTLTMMVFPISLRIQSQALILSIPILHLAPRLVPYLRH